MTSFGYQQVNPDNNHKEIKDVAHMPQMDFQTHVHEFLGSTMLAGPTGLIHNHRFAGVTSEVIPSGGSHIHGFFVNNDFAFQHLHEVAGLTGLAIPVGDGRHIHFVKAVTTLNRGHVHNLIFVTLIENPIG